MLTSSPSTRARAPRRPTLAPPSSVPPSRPFESPPGRPSFCCTPWAAALLQLMLSRHDRKASCFSRKPSGRSHAKAPSSTLTHKGPRIEAPYSWRWPGCISGRSCLVPGCRCDPLSCLATAPCVGFNWGRRCRARVAGPAAAARRRASSAALALATAAETNEAGRTGRASLPLYHHPPLSRPERTFPRHVDH
jgi:hypothetical protein